MGTDRICVAAHNACFSLLQIGVLLGIILVLMLTKRFRDWAATVCCKTLEPYLDKAHIEALFGDML